MIDICRIRDAVHTRGLLRIKRYEHLRLRCKRCHEAQVSGTASASTVMTIRHASRSHPRATAPGSDLLWSQSARVVNLINAPFGLPLEASRYTPAPPHAVRRAGRAQSQQSMARLPGRLFPEPCSVSSRGKVSSFLSLRRRGLISRSHPCQTTYTGSSSVGVMVKTNISGRRAVGEKSRGNLPGYAYDREIFTRPGVDGNPGSTSIFHRTIRPVPDVELGQH